MTTKKILYLLFLEWKRSCCRCFVKVLCSREARTLTSAGAPPEAAASPAGGLKAGNESLAAARARARSPFPNGFVPVVVAGDVVVWCPWFVRSARSAWSAAHVAGYIGDRNILSAVRVARDRLAEGAQCSCFRRHAHEPLAFRCWPGSVRIAILLTLLRHQHHQQHRRHREGSDRHRLPHPAAPASSPSLPHALASAPRA